jgi:hypothetical protein
MKLERTLEQWAKCVPIAMSQMSDAAIMFAFIDAKKDISTLAAEIEALKEVNATALGLLAAWCCAIERNGTGWDDWDEYYKDAAFRPGPLREQLDAAIAAEKAECGMS